MVIEPDSAADVAVLIPPEGDDDSEVGDDMTAEFDKISGETPAPAADPAAVAADGADDVPVTPAADGTPAAPGAAPVVVAPADQPATPKTAIEEAEAMAAEAEAAEQWWAPILAAHPDAFDLADDPKLHEWAKANGKDVSAKASPADVISHIAAFKLQRGPQPAAAPVVAAVAPSTPVTPAATLAAGADDMFADLKFKTKDGRELTWQEYREQFAEIADAQEAGLRRLADILAKRAGMPTGTAATAPAGSDVQALQRALADQAQQTAELRAQLDLIGSHADALQVLKSDGYRAWLPKQSPRLQKLATFRDAESQGKILLAYKESLVEAERQKATQVGQQDRSRQKSLHGASLQSGAQRPAAAGATKDDDFDGAWGEATGGKK